MAGENERRYWKIQGWDGTTLLFERKVLAGQVTDRSMKMLLRALVAKISLTEDEIINSYAKKNTKIYHNHLEVKHLGVESCKLICGDNPYVIATVE